jgi:hypothetical protein
MFADMPFKPDLVVIDEGVTLKAAWAVEMAPERLLDTHKWEGAARLLEIAKIVAHALAQPGQELAVLREAGVDAKALGACKQHLRDRHRIMVEAIAEAGKNGAPEGRLRSMIDALRAAELRSLAMLFGNLQREIATSRAGTNATRLVHRAKMFKEPDGTTHEEWLDRYIVSRPRRSRFSSEAELILLDGTGDLSLNRHLLGEGVIERRCAVDRQGLIIQITSTTNSKYRLLHREGAEKNRAMIASLINDIAGVVDGSLLVGCTKKVKEKLKEEGALDDVMSMHFGAERGLNSAERCAGVLEIGREEPRLYALEDIARGFTIESEASFTSVLDDKEQGRLQLYKRRRRMRDGSEQWAQVRSHPDPIARSLLEQMREAGIVQMADRVRSIWRAKLIIIDTNLPVDLDVTHLMTEGDLMRAASQAAKAKRALAEQGWWLRAGRAQNGREGIRGREDDLGIDLLLQNRLLLAQFPVLLPGARGAHPTQATLFTTLPPAEAIRRAAEVHPGLRPAPPEGGILRECLRRHGLVATGSALPVLVPDLVPDEVAVRAVRDAEAGELAALRLVHPHALYRVSGRRGRPGVLVWDPDRVFDPAYVLAVLLGADVRLDKPSNRHVPLTPGRQSGSFQAADEEDGEMPLESPRREMAAVPEAVWPQIIEDGGDPPPLHLPKLAPLGHVRIVDVFKIKERMVFVTVSPAASAPQISLVA